MNKKRLALPLLCLTVAIQCLGWGQRGHDIVATIAERHLTANARQQVDSLLEGRHMVYWSNWLDNASHTPEYKYTANWHFKNTDVGEVFAQTPVTEKGDILMALQQQTQVLGNQESSYEERALALKMVVHLMGDLHQPMHMGRAVDLGGNRIHVTCFRQQTSLHTAWDTNIVESLHKWSHTEWADEIDYKPFEQMVDETAGDFCSWGEQTYEVCQRIYDATPEGTAISFDYLAEWGPVVEQQLLRAGLRLATVLNAILK